MAQRKIVQIDEEKCDGCGLCIPACAEGALQIIEGKARLVSEVYCDGLGACLGECPQGAVSVVQRDAEAFDQEAARRHVERLRAERAGAGVSQAAQPDLSGCPGAAPQDLKIGVNWPGAPAEEAPPDGPSGELSQWPIQLHLVPPDAPYLKGADLLLVADCVPFAFADFHRRLLRKRPVVIGCPKLDDLQAYVDKLAAIVAVSSIQSLTVVHMEVPCCTGLVRAAEAAIKVADKNVPLEDVTISIRGRILRPGA